MAERLTVATKQKVEFRDITGEIRGRVRSSGVKEGLCHLFVPHTTAGISLNEHADPAVVRDIAAALDRLVPERGSYSHSEGNAPAHVKASLVGASASVMIEGGNLVLGTWQGIFFCEFDGPRNRTLFVKIQPF